MLHNITISFCKNALKITKPWPRDGETCWGPVPKIYTNFEETLSCAHVKFWRIKRGLGVFHNYYYLLILQLLLYIIILFSLAATAPQWALASSFTRFVFLDHKQRHTTVGRTPLNEWSVRRRDLYLTTHPPEVWSVPPVTPCIYGVMISRWMGWAGNVASVEEIRNTWNLRSENLKVKPRGGAVGWGTALQATKSWVRTRWCHRNFPLTQFF